MQLIPINNRLIVKRTAAEEKSAGGIILAEADREKPTTGVIVSFDANTEQPIGVGMIVLFGKFAGSDFTIDGEDYLILKEDEIIALVQT